MIIAYCCQSGCRDNHHLSETTNFLLCDIAEGFYDNSRFLLKIMRMQFLVPTDSSNCLGSRHFRVVLYIFGNLITHFVCSIVCQNVENKPFFNCLPHRVDVEGMERTIRLRFSKYLQSFSFGRCSKGKETHVAVFTLAEHFLHKNIVCLDFFDSLFFQFGIFCKSIAHIGKSSLEF